MDGNTVSVQRLIKASPDQIFALIADAGNHASFDGSSSLNHATQPPAPLSKGATFGMAMRGRKETLFIPYRTTNTVIEYDPTGASPGRRPLPAAGSVAGSGATNSSPPTVAP